MIGAAPTETIGSTDGTATGSFAYSHTFANVPALGRQITGVSWASGATTLTAVAGTFQAGDVNRFVAGPTGGGINPQSTIVSIAGDGSSATISIATTAAQTNVAIGTGENMTFADPAFSTGNVFTTNGVEGGQANIGVTSVSSVAVNNNVLNITFGGQPGTSVSTSDARCLLTGFDGATPPNPGPAQFGQLTPLLPPGTTTALVAASGGFITQPNTAAAITPPAAAFVNLVTPDTTPPVAGNATATIDRNVSNTTTLALPATDNVAVASCSLAGSPSDPRLSVNISNSPTPCAATLTDNGSASVGATVTFQYNATDTSGNPSTSPGTVTVTIVPAVDNTPPVAGNATFSLTAGGSTTTALPATDNVAVASCSLVGSPSDPRLSVSIAPNSCQATLTDSGTTSATVTFQYNATDTSNNVSLSPGTVTVNIVGQVVDGALDVIVNGPVSSSKTSKAIVGKVTNAGTGTLHVCDTDFSWAVTVNGTPTGSVAGTGACSDLGPGASKRFKFSWTYPAGSVVTGDAVSITGTLNVAGDVNAGNNSDTEARTAK
jgi:hypothetical protein